MNPYTSIKTLTSPDLYTPMYDFISTVSPDLDRNNIIRGWQNRYALPKDSNDFCIMTVLELRRNGTNISEYVFDEAIDNEILFELFIGSIQFDFCSQNQDIARMRAQTVETLSRTEYAVRFFESYGITPLYADSVRDLTAVDLSSQYVPRMMTTFYFSFYTNIILDVSTFSNINVDFRNVDIVYPPTT